MALRPAIVLMIICSISGGHVYADDAVNPHWTGTHCRECHTDEQGGELRFRGDSIQICNRCHATQAASSEPHPVGVILPEAMKRQTTHRWPLQEGKITCLTCHDALPQMYDKPFEQFFNSSFLRIRPAASQDELCFSCHDKKDYRKENPHQQLDAAGTIMEQTCLSCHRTVPDVRQTSAYNTVANSLRDEAEKLCTSCHGGKHADHPVRGNHLVAVPDTMREIQRLKTNEQGVYLPLFGNRISCVTCHNPHQRGVLKQSGVSAGAGEEYFLRLRRGQTLCIHCHQDIELRETSSPRCQNIPPVAAKPERSMQHKPYAEGKCKACHAIDGYNGDNRQSFTGCFQKGCHETSLVRNAFLHETSVLGSCSFCHSPHNAGYEKLLFVDENTLCAVCHPLLRGKDDVPLKKADHKKFTAYASNNPAIPPGYECRFCHNPAHGRELGTISTEQCGACHLYLREEVSAGSHQKYAGRSCSSCHDAHASAHEYLLKQPLEAYRR